MPHRILHIIIISIFISLGALQSQNVHFSRYDFQPLLLNPANNGSYLGSYRVTAIYRDQWANLLPNRFSTPAISIDAPLGFSFREQDWIGVGVNFYQDRAGAGKLTTTGFNGYLSYHLALDKKQTNVLTIGLTGGSKTRKLGNVNDFIFEDQTSGIGSLSLESSGGTVFGAGILYKTSINETDEFRFGVAALNLLPLKYQLTNSSNEKEIPEFNIHAEGSFELAEGLALEPAVVYQIKESMNLGYGQAKLAYSLDDDKNFRLVGGLGYRLGRAVQVLAGIDYQGWRAGIGYDLNTDPLSPAQSFEIGMSYIGKIYKRPKVKEVILCPPF
ncbi:PorP/SprF family type IX secretion system membrane protein [Membranicola marinus]|uniref:PorP/SprF family type IX secretion system membrane protein n=1 Tax=Membranihabitans marinus TaxID=1227546 RepID=A0A953LC03_9BACT|nr:PorP/SprF family type IX secretion system membrane protein [Membranihabitans marinus]MBY5957254.1 PorP/SprF family type IX secretion system membrane protein [Membranihabitans marinus]